MHPRIKCVAVGSRAEDGVRSQTGERGESGDDQTPRGTGVSCDDMTKNRSALENVCGKLAVRPRIEWT